MRPVNTAEWLTRGTVWLALSLYVAAEMVTTFRSRAAGFATARWFNGFGVAAFIGHVACAFHFHHQWSHAVAYGDTARQTAEFTGWNWGGGLYLNYLFAVVWLISGSSFSANARPIRLLNVSYDPTREFYSEVNEAFARRWNAQSGDRLSIKQSHVTQFQMWYHQQCHK